MTATTDHGLLSTSVDLPPIPASSLEELPTHRGRELPTGPQYLVLPHSGRRVPRRLVRALSGARTVLVWTLVLAAGVLAGYVLAAAAAHLFTETIGLTYPAAECGGRCTTR